MLFEVAQDPIDDIVVNIVNKWLQIRNMVLGQFFGEGRGLALLLARSHIVEDARNIILDVFKSRSTVELLPENNFKQRWVLLFQLLYLFLNSFEHLLLLCMKNLIFFLKKLDVFIERSPLLCVNPLSFLLKQVLQLLVLDLKFDAFLNFVLALIYDFFHLRLV